MILPGERASARNHQFQTEELAPSIPKILSDVFKFEYSCVFIFVDRNLATVAFAWDFFAFSERTLTMAFVIPFMAGPYEQTTCLKYYSGRRRGLEYRKLFGKIIARSSGQRVRRWQEIITFVSDDEILQEDATFNFRENMWHSVNSPVKTERIASYFSTLEELDTLEINRLATLPTKITERAGLGTMTGFVTNPAEQWGGWRDYHTRQSKP